MRLFWEANRNITYRYAYINENTKLQGENYDPVKTYVDMLKQLKDQNEGILKDSDCFWNPDEAKLELGLENVSRSSKAPQLITEVSYLHQQQGESGRHVT